MKRTLSTSFAFFFGLVCSYAQLIITGTVTDETGQPIPGVNIVEKGTTNGVIADFDGNYTIQVRSNATIAFSSLGFKPEEVVVDSQETIDIILAQQTSELDEVVVVGYGTVKKSDLTGSIASVSGNDLNQRTISSLDQGLKGISSGVQVISSSGEPGAAANLRIRGGSSINASNEPLYVLDGFPIANSGISTNLTNTDNSSPSLNPLATLNPNDIASIEVLKDASATAIYGSRGANGVVIITTKRGRSGKPEVTYSGYSGIQTVIKKLDVLNASEFVALANRGNVFSSTYNNTVDPTSIDPIYQTRNENGQTIYIVKNGNEVTGTDWQNEIFRSAIIHDHQIGIRGGTENSTYLTSVNYFDQDGVVINSGFKRLSLRLNADIQISPKIKVGNSLTVTRSENNAVFATTNNASSSVVGAALNMPPIVPVFDKDGEFAFMEDYSVFGSTTNNPVALATEPRNDLFSNRALWSIFGEYEMLPGLVYKANFGMDYTDSRRELYQPQSYFSGRRLLGEGGIGNLFSRSWLHESTLNYTNTFNEKHNLNLLTGFTTQNFFSRSSRIVKTNFDSDDLQNYAVQNGQDFNLDRTGSAQGESRLDSYLGRINYDFDKRYFITITGRVDGSTRFGADNKYGFFPSAALAWRVSEESFLQDNESLSNLKIRGSFGVTGNQAIGDYNSLVRISTINTTLGTGGAVGFFPSTPGNPDLKWETTTQWNVGTDIELFKKLNMTFDYYVKTTDDLIFNATLPSSSGFTSVVKNAGSIENRGWEFSIDAPVVLKEDFSWRLSANISANRNEVLDLGESDEILVNNALISEGQPLGSFYTYIFDGIFQSQEQIDNTPYAANYNETAGNRPLVPGHVILRDLNGDGEITPEDKTFVGDPNPDYIFGLTSKLFYKNINLDIIVTGVQGIDIFNETYRTDFNGNLNGGSYILNSWTPQNNNNTFPAATFTFTGETRGPSTLRSSDFPTNRSVEDGSFVRLDNVKLGYTFNNSLIEGIQSLNIYVSGNNLLTITNYRGFDPDVNSRAGQGNANLGRDEATYPRAKTILLGLNVTF